MKKHRWIAWLLCLFLILPAGAVQAEESKTEEQYLLEAVIRHLIINSRYEDLSEKGFYQAAVEKILEENPALYETALKGMLESIDQYSEYYTAEESEELMISVSGEISGIGVTLDFSDPAAAVVASVIPGTPAERAGLRVGDKIVSANGVDLRNAKSEIILSHVRGEVGTEVYLEVDREGAILGFTMKREKVMGTTSITQEAKNVDGHWVMYIRIHGFVNNTAQMFKEALRQADQNGISDLVLDLRNNGGGVLSQAIQMAQEFVPKGKVVTTEDHKLKAFNKTYKGLATKQKYNVVLLMNEYSASASEVFAAALKENGLAKIVGVTSYGKGTIQSINSLAAGGSIKFTSGFYLTPEGNNINGVGIAPDYWVENTMLSLDKSQYEDFGYTKVYRLGDTGSEVKTAKEILAAYGLYQGELDETFDKELEAAIYAFQSQAKLYPYGVMDITTQINLRNYLDLVKIEQDDQLDEALKLFVK